MLKDPNVKGLDPKLANKVKSIVRTGGLVND
jgi:hypothetical protein